MQGPRPTEPPDRPPSERIVEALAGIVGADRVLTEATDRAPYETDWRGKYHGRCLAVVQPGSNAEVAKVVAYCSRHGVPIVPQGGNTGLCAGATPDDSGTQIVLTLQRLRQLRSLDAEDGHITCGAGMPLAEAQAHAEAAGMLLPLSIASEGTATIGGVVSTNAGGLNVLHYGSARQLLLGIEAVLPDGSVVSRLTPLRKDNTGYDLTSLLAGSEGTLGIVTAATLSLSPRPVGYTTFLAGLADVGQARATLRAVRTLTASPVTSWELFSEVSAELLVTPPMATTLPLEGPHAWYLLGELSHFGEPADILDDLAEILVEHDIEDVVVATSAQQRADLWAIREDITEAERAAGPTIKHDISVAPSQIDSFIETLLAACRDLDDTIRLNIFGHVGDGNLHINVLPRERGQELPEADQARVSTCIYDLTRDAGGSFSAEHGIGQQKIAQMARYKSGAEIGMMRRLKASLDPTGIMNPGKVLP
ncbi:FAD-binding oxidoreductase [Pseudoroseicyclus tamaricis]|uniref:FAD-binding oxidoreductase n=1 Tax=Pseudoroseicyclus tamaricis TaxID=2705421 RepID=A0A6B2JH63_9RHOB|nr:FAD-binding oxidoreductase [Pseudoroseicyclus tamaricis]NDV00553.1 FAD-binding oxidoreductase [Pseudoroseicyclus tamaricis]